MKRKQILVYMVLLSTAFANGQNANSLDDEYTPSKKSIFGQMGSSAKNNNASFEGRCSNMLSLSLTDFVHSQIRVVYERKVNSNFSGTVGFGWIFHEDYVENVSSLSEFRKTLFHQNDNGISIATLLNNSRFESGYAFSTSVKRVFNEESEKAIFAEFGYKYSRLNYQLAGTISGVPVSNSLFDAKFNVFSVSLGKVWILGWEKVHYTHEISGGLGLKFHSWDKYLLTDNPNGFCNIYEKQEGQSIFNIYPIFVFRYQVGIGW